MDIQAIREVHLAEPFRPFYVFLVDGRKLLVKERFNMGYSPSGKAMAIYTGPDVAESISAGEIVKLEQAKRFSKKKAKGVS